MRPARSTSLDALGPEIVKPFLDDPDFTVQFGPAGPWSLQNVYPNLLAETMDDGSPNPFLDLRVRQAGNHAVNRQALIDNLLLGVGEQSLFAFSGIQGYPTPEQKQEVIFDYDPERARATDGRGRLPGRLRHRPCTGRPTGAARTRRTLCWPCRRT